MSDIIWDLVVVGGGAAGLAAALTARRRGARVLVLERTNECGKKLAITGGKKGNFTHNDEPDVLARQFNTEPRVLLKLMRRFPYTRIVSFFGELGIRHMVDEDGCIWPVPKSAPRLRDELVKAIVLAGGRIEAKAQVRRVVPSPSIGGRGQGEVGKTQSAICNLQSVICNESESSSWQVTTDIEVFTARNVLIATGGKSYPATGSSGDGYVLAAQLGHRIETPYSALASLATAGEFRELGGITIGKTTVRLRTADCGLRNGGNPDSLHSAVRNPHSAMVETAPFLFAGHYITGRAVINLSGFAGKALLVGQQVSALVDWLPDSSEEELQQELADERIRHGKQHISNFIASKSAKRLAELLCKRAEVPGDRKLAELTREETRRILDALKRTEIAVTGTEPLERATVTGGGVALDEVDLNTFESKLHRGLYFAGEVLDVWGRSGGYNLHFAWASGIAVGEAVEYTQ